MIPENFLARSGSEEEAVDRERCASRIRAAARAGAAEARRAGEGRGAIAAPRRHGELARERAMVARRV